MATETKRRPPPDFDELDAEREVDLKRYWNALVTYWWLPLAGLVAGLIVGYLLSLGGNQVYKATVLLSLGQPFSGTSSIQGLPTNPTYVDEYVHSEFASRIAAAKAGLRPGQVRNNVSTKTVSGARGALRAGQTPLFEISLTGSAPKKVDVATESLAQQVIDQLSVFVNKKIEGYRTLDASYAAQLASNQQRIKTARAAVAAAAGLSPVEQLVLYSNLDGAIQQNGQLLLAQAENQEQLALAEEVEKPRVIAPPVPVKTTARSTRNSMLVGGAIGLLLGVFAAFLWEPVTTRLRRT